MLTKWRTWLAENGTMIVSKWLAENGTMIVSKWLAENGTKIAIGTIIIVLASTILSDANVSVAEINVLKTEIRQLRTDASNLDETFKSQIDYVNIRIRQLDDRLWDLRGHAARPARGQ